MRQADLMERTGPIEAWRWLRGPVWALLLATIAIGSARAEEDVWSDLRQDLFGERPIADGGAWLEIEAPYRAHDAALVPIDIVALRPQTADAFIRTITLVIDQNPAPVAAVFHLGPQSGLASISTRVRVNAYSEVRAIAETNAGELFMVSRFVKASGGCSAPAVKDQDEALANLGKMRLRQFGPAAGAMAAAESDGALARADLREAQLLIRHPNNSGLQMDQVTRHYIPAHFVRDIEILQGDQSILKVEGAISLSEDPSLRFHFVPNGAESLTVRAEDTEDQVFTGTWQIERPAGSGS